MILSKINEAQENLTTQRLRLVPIASQHREELWPHMSNSEISTYLAWSAHPDKAFCEKVINDLCQSRLQNKAIHWTIFQENKVCGLISFIDIRMNHLSWILNRSELAYWIAPAFQNQGLMTEACLEVIRFGFEVCQFHKIIVAHASENLPSAKVIDKLGFRYVGEEIDAFNKFGQWYNLKHYEMINGLENNENG